MAIVANARAISPASSDGGPVHDRRLLAVRGSPIPSPEEGDVDRFFVAVVYVGGLVLALNGLGWSLPGFVLMTGAVLLTLGLLGLLVVCMRRELTSESGGGVGAGLRRWLRALFLFIP